MQHPPEVSPDLAHMELSKRLDSIERRLDRMETNQREDNAQLRQDMQQDNTQLRQDNAQLRQDMQQDNAQLRQDMQQANAQLRQEIAETNRRIDRLTRWIIGIQLTTLIALGTLILTRLPG